MGRHRFALGVHIEGIGKLGGTSADGTLFVSRKDPAYDGAWSVDLWSAIEEIPDVLRDDVDLWRAEYRTSAAEIGLVLDDEAELPQALIPQSWGEEAAEVVRDNGSTIEVAPPGQISAADVYFCGTESIEFNSQASTTSTTETWNVTRGMYLSAEVTHFAGQYIYERPPDLVERPMRVVLIEDGEPSEVIWTGLIANWQTNGGHTKLDLKARSLNQVFRKQQLNNRAKSIDHEGNVVDPTTINWKVTGLSDGFDPLYGDGSTNIIYVQAGGRPFRAQHNTQDGGTISPTHLALPDKAPPFDSPPLSADEPIWQILVHSEQHSIYEDLGGGASGPGEPELPHDHVMTMALCHLTSTGQGGNDVQGSQTTYATDIFSEDFGIGMPQRLLDVDAWVDVILRYPTDTADRFIWGWDGSKVDIWQKIKAWCRAYNYVIVPNEEGRLAPVKITSLELTDGAKIADQSAYLAEHDAPIDAEGEEAMAQISADYDSLPFVDASSESVRVEGRRRMTLLRDAEANLDLTWLSRENEQKVRELLEDHADKRGEHPPVMEVVATREHHGPTGTLKGEFPPLARWVQIRGGPDRGLMGPTGEYIDPGYDQVTFTGIVISREIDTERHLVTATILLWMWGADLPARLVAPSAEVGTDPEAGAAVGSDSDGDWISYDGSTLNAYDGTVGFMVGDDVTIERPDGVGHDQTLEITEVDAQNERLYVDQPPSPSGWVEPGHLIRCTNEQQFANTGWAGSSYWSDPDLQDRRYTYIVGVSGGFASGEPADTYTGV